MLLEGEEDEAKSCQVLIPVLVVNNDSIDVNKGSFDVTKDRGRQPMDGSLRSNDSRGCVVPLKLSLARYHEDSLSCLFMGLIHLPGVVRDIQG